jgi:hypothetical protein
MNLDRPFFPGYVTPKQPLLGRYLPPLPAGMVKAWLDQNVPTKAWILDPLGSTPAGALEAARAGYRVMVTSNNPINSFLIELLASAPTKADFKATLAEIATTRRGDERLEDYLQSLYLTVCENCNQEIFSQYFLWKREEKQPFGRVYRCPHCGDEGERVITASDIGRLARLGSDQLHRSRALGRISIDKDLAHARASEALSIYLPRPLDFLLTFINKLEGLQTSPQRKQLLYAMALAAADEGSTLWPWPSSRARPRQIYTPPQFREANLWQVIEDFVNQWHQTGEKIPLARWPDLPPEDGGICLFPGRLKTLVPLLDDFPISAAMAVFPRTNQAYWTLSALWSGWLWGREAVQPIRSALERRRYDWQWHANALHNTLQYLQKVARQDFIFYGILPELAPGFATAAMVATQAAGMTLEGISLRAEQLIAQTTWRIKKTPSVSHHRKTIETAAREAIRSNLQQRNESAPFLTLQFAALAAIIQQEAAASTESSSPGEIVSKVQNHIQQVFADSQFIRRFDKETQKAESGLWSLVDDVNPQTMPLADQIEMNIVRYLDRHTSASLESLDAALCAQFPGTRTPPIQLIQACLDSYAEQAPQSPGFWQLRARENPVIRQQDILNMRAILSALGQRLDYRVGGENPLRWLTASDETAYMFFLFASSMIGRFVYSPPAIAVSNCILVLPGSRANLLAYKLQRDPQLAEAANAGWRFLKFRHVTRLGEMTDLDRAHFDTVLAQDPVSWEEPVQMSMFDTA